MTTSEKLYLLRRSMREKNIDIYVVPTSDEHQSEYVEDHFKCREFLSGFTGSAGTLVITKDKAGLWTDGRYFIQAENELVNTAITLYRMNNSGVPTVSEYIKKELPFNGTLGFDGKVISMKMALDLEKEISIKSGKLESSYDLIDDIWYNRPTLSENKITTLENKYVCRSVGSILKEIREKMQEYRCTHHLISSLDDIAWILGLRGNDIKNDPVFLSYCLISLNDIILYVDHNKFNNDVRSYLDSNNVKVKDHNDIYEDIKTLDKTCKILINDNTVNYYLYSLLPFKENVVIKESPSTLMKAIKNDDEIKNIKDVHLKDGIAVTKFMYWLKTVENIDSYTESDIVNKLGSLRKDQPGYIEPSFDTIAAVGSNAAMMHYHPTKEKSNKLEKGKMLLIDSGGQYYGGTTDITRTYSLGHISDDLKRDNTLVLKGMLALSNAKFLYGVTGTNLDILARSPMWEHGIDYKCGTGHGVGYMLSVHEGPHAIRPAYNPQVLQPGMIVTDEPGIYIEGSHGIRIENELLVREIEKNQYGIFLGFEVLTISPIDIDAICTEMLSEKEQKSLNEYHKMVYNRLSAYLSEKELDWLQKYTKEI